MDRVAHIPAGPRVRVAGQGRREQRMQHSAEDMAMARTLVSSPAWEWFVAKCEQKALVLEKQLVDVMANLNQRQEDRYRGMADSYRRMPGVVNEVARAYERAVEADKKQQHKEQKQHG